MTNKSFSTSSLLKLAGFVLIVGLGHVSNLAIAVGGVFYLVGIFAFAKSDADGIEKRAIFSLILLLCNLAFFSTLEIISLLDISLAVYILILLDLTVLTLRKFSVKPETVKLTYKWPVAFFLVSIVFSGFRTEQLKDAIYYFVIYAFAFALFYFSINLISRKSSVLALLKAFVGISFVSALVAIWQLYSQSFKAFYYPYIAARDQEILELWEVVSRVVGTWQHPSYLGIMLAISVPVGLYLLFYETKNRSLKLALGAALVIISSVLLLTNTRSSVISAVIGVLALFWISRSSRGRILPTAREFAAIGIIAAGALLLYQFVFVAEIYTKPQAWRVDASATIWGRFLRSDRMSTESLVQRSQLYALAWEEFKEHPITGIGGKNFPYTVEGHFERGTDAHNIFLQTLAETGLIGFVALLLLYGKFLTDVLFARPQSVDPKLKAVLASFLAVILFDSLFNNPLYSLRILAMFWLVAGLLIAAKNFKYDEASNQPVRLES